MEFFQYLPLSEARNLIVASLDGVAAAAETVDLADALDRIAAKAIVAQDTLPPFDRSTVDGFAVRSADTFGASEAVPVLLALSGEVAMGEQVTTALAAGKAMAISTGGMLPEGVDAVVMVEYTEHPDADTVLVARTVAPGENIVSKGEDIQAGNVILRQGERIGPQHIGALAACGCSRVVVARRVEVAVISSGDELVAIDEQPGIGQIRDINSYALGAMLTDMGCVVRRWGIVRDSYEAFYDTLAKALTTCQLLVISGGSSVGARDFTVQAVAALGKPGVLMHGIALKPGRPTIFGMIGAVPVFGLPGHPVSAMVVCQQLVMPAVRLLTRQKQPFAAFSVPARLSRNVASAPGRDDFVSVRLRRQGEEFVAEPILGKSGLISIMSQADGLMHIPADKSGQYEGERVEVLLIRDRG